MLRLIMNLTATNDVSLPFEGDIGALPYFSQWRSLILGPDEELLWSYDDMKGAFYLFKLPDSWAPLFAFNVCFRAKELGLEEDKYKEGGVYLGAVTMPMGYLNAMGLVQYLHRRLLARGPQHPDGFWQVKGDTQRQASACVASGQSTEGLLAGLLRRRRLRPESLEKR